MLAPPRRLFLTDSQKDHLFVQKVFAPDNARPLSRPLAKDKHLRKHAHLSHASACSLTDAAYLRLKRASLDLLPDPGSQPVWARPPLLADLPFDSAVLSSHAGREAAQSAQTVHQTARRLRPRLSLQRVPLRCCRPACTGARRG